MSELDNPLSLTGSGPSAALTGSKTRAAGRTASIKRQKLRENTLAYAFLAPSLLLFGVFLFYPLLKSVYLSLHSTDPTGRVAAFVGMDNFAGLFSSGLFVNGMKVTALFALLTVPAGMLLALALAALTHSRLPGKRLFQFAFSLPLVLSVGSAAVIWKFLFHPTLGMLNYLLGLAGVSPVQWLVSPDWALVSIALMTVWMNLGFNYIILSSGMQGIPDELYESATIDGAGPITVFRKITLPLLSPTLFFLLVVSIISAFQSFGQINILTMGGPMNRTNVFVYTIYQEAFVNFRFGTGSAQALLLFLVIMLLTLIQFKWVERKVHYQ
ncbi:sugar ABC transporter permease [Paenibacillus macerans]|uniref:carbohydrate ABC transporter permease n=1 Tax=Paenibacillus macerans TaxID=44252 RepID=UPI003D28D1BB